MLLLAAWWLYRREPWNAHEFLEVPWCDPSFRTWSSIQPARTSWCHSDWRTWIERQLTSCAPWTDARIELPVWWWYGPGLLRGVIRFRQGCGGRMTFPGRRERWPAGTWLERNRSWRWGFRARTSRTCACRRLCAVNNKHNNIILITVHQKSQFLVGDF